MMDYRKIADAVSFYERAGYEHIDVPWFVSKESLDVTRPPNARPFDTFAGSLVASGEQSFIEIRKQLGLGKYQCVTPCFRDEEQHDELHLQYFVKNELIWVVEKDNYDAQLYEMLGTARNHFSQYGEVAIVSTDIGKDLLINEIEVGSYGYREHDGFCWVYGTGCAEPRLSQALAGWLPPDIHL